MMASPDFVSKRVDNTASIIIARSRPLGIADMAKCIVIICGYPRPRLDEGARRAAEEEEVAVREVAVGSRHVRLRRAIRGASPAR